MACIHRVLHIVQSAVTPVLSHAMLGDIHLLWCKAQMGSNQVVIFHCMGLATKILQKQRMTVRPRFDDVKFVPGCVQKATSDASGFFCVPAGVTGIPPLSSATIVKYNSCSQGSFAPPDCQATQMVYEAGTGCLDKCQAEFQKQVARSLDFCKGHFWECPGTAAPCSGALPADSAPMGADNPSSALSEAPEPSAGAVCGSLVVRWLHHSETGRTHSCCAVLCHLLYLLLSWLCLLRLRCGSCPMSHK
jgi:hypothetical protein